MNPNSLTPQELAQVASIRANRFGNPQGLKPTGLDKDVKTPNELTKDLIDSFSDNLQTDWNAFRLQDIPNALGEGLQDALDSVSLAIDTIRPIVTIIRSALEVLLTLADLALDLLSAAFEAAILLLEAVIDLFNTTTMSYIQYVPKNKKMFKTTREVLNVIANSYDDEWDVNRPISRSESDTHLFVGILPAFADWSKLIEVIKELAKLFDFSGEHLKVTTFKKEDYPNNLFKLNIGAYPNWSSGTLRNLKFVSTITDTLNGLIANLRTAQGKTELIRSLLKRIEQRLELIEAKINQVLDVLEALINLSLLPINTLTVYGAGDISSVQNAVAGASFLETYPLQTVSSGNAKGSQEVDICAAFCLHFALGTGKALEFVRQLFAIKEKAKSRYKEDVKPSTDRFEQSIDNAGTRYTDINQKFKVVWNAPTGGQGEE